MLAFFYYLLVFAIPMPDNPWWAWPIGPLTPTKILGIVCLIAGFAYLAARSRWPPFLRLKSGRLFVFLILVELVSDLFREGLVVGPSVLSNDLAVFSLFIVTLIFVNSIDQLRKVALIVIGSVAFDSLFVIRQWQGFHNVYGDFRGWGGVAGDPNYYAISVVLWAPAMILWLTAKRPRWERLYCLGCLLVTLVGFSISASRGGMLGLTAGLLIVIAYSRHRLRNVAVLGLLVLSLGFMSGTSPVSRLLHPTKSDQESSQDRLDLWHAGLQSIREHPLAGVGVSGFKPKAMRNGVLVDLPFHVAHNTYVDYAVNLGVVGFVPFVGLLIASLWSLKRLGQKLRRSDPSAILYKLTLGVQAGIAGYAVSAFFLSTWWQQVFWLSVFLSMCLPFLDSPPSQHLHALAVRDEVSEIA